MATKKSTKTKKAQNPKTVSASVTKSKAVKVKTPKKVEPQSTLIVDRIQDELERKSSTINLVLGILIVIVGGILVFNLFNKPTSTLISPEQNQPAKVDVAKDKLPGEYTIKPDDTLFLIAQKYYDDGYQYPLIVAANKIADENNIEVGQVLTIPKNTTVQTPATVQASVAPMQTPNPTAPEILSNTTTTQWGELITGDSYTVVAGDWLSTIAARAYGDVSAYTKIAQANNLTDPNNIEVGTVLKLPR